MLKISGLLLALVLVGCSSPVAGLPPTPTNSIPGQALAPGLPTILPPTLTQQSPPAGVEPPTSSPQATMPAPTSPMAMGPETPTPTLSYPKTLSLLPGPGTTQGWKTFTDPSAHIALDYPPDWSVSASGGVITFASPNGLLVQLAPVGTGAMSPGDFLNNQELPNTRCSSETNSHGIIARVCFDTISFSTSAEFIVRAPDGSQHLLSLQTSRRTGDLAVFAAMIASLRVVN